MVSLLFAVGCASKTMPIFEPVDPPIRWPSEPARARIQYVGQIASSADLKRPRQALERFADLFAGKKEPSALYGPRDVLVTEDGQHLWIADPGGRCLHLMDLEDRSYTKIERAGDSLFVAPVGLARGPAGSIFVCDSQSASIHRFESDSGTFIESLRLPEDLLRPVAMSYRASDDTLFVVDVIAHDIKVVTMDGRVDRILGRRGSAPGTFNFPSDIADDGRMIWIADTGNQRIQGLTYDGEPIVSFGQAGDAPGDLALPKAVATDSAGNIYVVDGRFENVQVFDNSGKLLLFFGEEGTGPGAFWLPTGLHIDNHDRIWICDSYNHRLQVFDRVDEIPAPNLASDIGPADDTQAVRAEEKSP